LHWKPIFDDQQVASIGSISVARSDPKIVWVGTGETVIRENVSIGDGIYKSVDAGQTWQHVGLDATGRIGRIAINPKDPNVIYAAAMGSGYAPQQERGLFRTRDGGKTWERVLFVDQNTGAIDVVVDPMNPQNVIAATWQLTMGPNGHEAGGPGSGLYISRDGGTNWTKLTQGLPDGPLGKIGLAIAPSNPKRVYALIASAGHGNLWRSEDLRDQDNRRWKNMDIDCFHASKEHGQLHACHP